MVDKMTISTPLVAIFLCNLFFCMAQQGGPNPINLESSFERDDALSLQTSDIDSLTTWQERIVLHVDKARLTAGEPIFFKAYALTGPNRVRVSMSKVLRVELLNDKKETVTKQFHKIENGTSEGAIALPRKLAKGTYTLRAYTRWMQNYGESFYFIKEMHLGDNKTTSDTYKGSKSPGAVSFHPEGGDLIAGLSNRLLIKINSDGGRLAGLDGKIVDGNNNEIADVVPFGSNYLSTIFTPEPWASYALKINGTDTYSLPKIVSGGHLLHVNNLDPDLLNIRVQATHDFIGSTVWLKGTMGGVIYFNKELELEDGPIQVNVPLQDIPFGVLTVSLSDHEGSRLTKRPISIGVKNKLKLEIVPLDQGAPDNELLFKVRVSDSQGNPVATEVSLSVTNVEDTASLARSTEPVSFDWGRYGATENNDGIGRKERYLSDLEVLTLADSKSDMISQEIPGNIKYPFQEGLDLVGYAYNLNNELLKNTEIQMLGASDNDVVAQVFKTDASGRVRLENLQFVGETELVFRTSGDDTSSRLVKIIPVQERFTKGHKAKAVLALDKKTRREATDTSPWQPDIDDDMIELKEVEVTDDKIERKRAMPPVYGMEAIASRTVVQDIEKPKFLFQLLSEIPGIAVYGDLEFPRLNVLRNASPIPLQSSNSFGSVLDQPGPLWVIDGFIYGNSDRVEPGMGLTSWDIDRIEFFSGAEAAMYGSRSAKGVFMIYTRNGSELDYINRKKGHLSFQGYYESPTFDAHIEAIQKKPKKYENKATTIFWNPSIKTDANGVATVRLKVPFEYKNLEVKASAVTEKGDIGSAKIIF